MREQCSRAQALTETFDANLERSSGITAPAGLQPRGSGTRRLELAPVSGWTKLSEYRHRAKLS